MDNHLLRFNKNVKYTVVDVESFNLNLCFDFNRPWQVTTLNFTGDKITSENDIRIDWSKESPHLKISADAARITRFDPKQHAKLAIEPKKAFEIFWNDLKNADKIIYHNGLRFDYYLLKGFAEYMREDWSLILNKSIDTMCIARGIKLGIPYNAKQGDFIEYQYRMSNVFNKTLKTSLKALCKDYGIEYDDTKSHDAKYDVLVTKLLFDKLKWQIEL